MKTTVARFRAVLRVKKTRIHQFLSAARVIHSSMSAEAERFPSPVPAMDLLLSQIGVVDAAQQLVDQGNRGPATSLRDVARDVLCTMLAGLKVYVQSVADDSMAESFAIITSSGYEVLRPSPRNKPILDAHWISTGVVQLIANARELTGSPGRRATYYWQYSLDGGDTWIPLDSTVESTTLVSGLPALTNCSFRVRVRVLKQMQPWSQVVTIFVR